MKINYCFDISEHDCEEYEYEVEETYRLNSVLKTYIKQDYPEMTEDDIESLMDNEDERKRFLEEFELELKDHFEEAAREEYEEHKAFKKNPDAFYGVSRKD